jgi:hypothetical protein
MTPRCQRYLDLTVGQVTPTDEAELQRLHEAMSEQELECCLAILGDIREWLKKKYIEEGR